MGGGNNYHIDVWFGWPTEPKRDVLYLHSASPSLTSPSSLMMSRHFIWQRPITGLGTSSTSNETACVHCVVVWVCCLFRPDYPASPAHSLFFHHFLSVALETTRPCVLLCPLRRHRKTVDLSDRFLKLKEKSKGQSLFTRTYWHVVLKHVWSVVFEVCIYCNRHNKQRPCDYTWLLFIKLKVTLLWLQEDQKQTDQKIPFNIRHNDVNLLLQGKQIVGMGVFILQTSSV